MPLRNFLPKACLLALATAAVAAAQGAPHLSITAPTYQVLVPPGTVITSSMCRPDNASCLAAAAANKPLFTTNNIYGMATDTLGNVYTTDDGNLDIVKTSASGTPQILAGQIGKKLTTIAPATASVSTTAFAFPYAVAVDLAGNVYIADEGEVRGTYGSYGSLLRLDPLGTVTRITGEPDPAQPVIQANSGAASLQGINPQSVATDLAGNVYVSDINTCTVREFTPATGLLKVIAGSLVSGCTGTTASPATGEQANTFALANITDIAVGNDGTVYITDSNLTSLYSVTPADGVIHLLATSTGSITAGPASSSGSIGSPLQGLAVDSSGDVFLNSASGKITALLEVTPGSGSQVVVVTSALSVSPSGDSAVFSGEPASAYVDLGYQQLAIDPTGRLYVTAPFYDSIVYLDRNSSSVFDTSTGTTQQILTLTNTGTGTLTGVSFGGTGLPYALSPTAAELIAEGLGSSPIVPFAVDTTTGTCLSIFATRNFSLVPGASCTLAIDYNSATAAPNAGSFTLYTNDPDGPTTVSLSATPVTTPSTSPSVFAATSITVSPAASLTANGSVTINTATTSSINSSGTEAPATPTGPLSIGLTNNATGVQTVQQATLSSATSTGYALASASFSGLAPGTYSVQAVYPGDGTSAASFSPVQTLYVRATRVDFTTAASIDYHFPYTGTTAQDVNFSAQAYTNPSAVEFQDLYAGAHGTGYAANLLDFTFLDPNGTPISPTSTAELGVGKYSVVPSVPNASTLGYGVTAHPASVTITPANLTVRGSYMNVPYGQFYVPSGVATPSGATALSLPINIYTAPPVFSTDEAASPTAPNAVALNATIDGEPNNVATLLPVGRYNMQPVLTGNGAGNYSLTAAPSELIIAPANLTIDAHYTNVRYGQVSGTNYPQAAIIETSAATAAADVTAGTLTLGATASGTVDSMGYLPPGHYTLTPTATGTATSNYSITLDPGLLVVGPADLTLVAASNTSTGPVSGQTLCFSCYTAPNASLLTTDPSVAFSFKITSNSSGATVATIPYGSSTTVTLRPDTYTVTPVITGGTPANYSVTIHPGTLKVISPFN